MVKPRVAFVAAGIAIAVGLFLVFVPIFRGQSGGAQGPSGMAGQTAPLFTLQDDNGKSASLQNYRGKIVFMNLWASWCPPCRAEMPDLQRFVDAYGARGVVVIGVNEGESPQQARAFAQSLRIRFPVWMDEQQRYGRTYAALGLPTTIVLSRDGRVLRGFDGPLTYAQMRDTVDPLIGSR